MTLAAIAPAATGAAGDDAKVRKLLAARRRNRSEHYWSLIEAANGRRKLRHAKDYFSAMLADQPPEMVEQAIRAVEALVHDSQEGN